MTSTDPELDAVVAACVGSGCAFVVVGGFAVNAHRHVRATEDVDLVIPDDAENDRRLLTALGTIDAITTATHRPPATADLLGRAHLRVRTRAGLVDLIREGDAPLDYATIERHALTADLGDEHSGSPDCEPSWR